MGKDFASLAGFRQGFSAMGCLQQLKDFNLNVLSAQHKQGAVPRWLEVKDNSFWALMGLLYEDSDGYSWTLFRSAIVAQDTALCSFLYKRAMQYRSNPLISLYYLLTGSGLESTDGPTLTDVEKAMHVVSYIVDKRETLGAFELQIPSAYTHMQRFIASTPALCKKWLDSSKPRAMATYFNPYGDPGKSAFLKFIQKYNLKIMKMKLPLLPACPPQNSGEKKSPSKQQRKKRRLLNQKSNLKIFVRELIGLNLMDIDLVVSLLVSVQYEKSDRKKRTRSSYNPSLVQVQFWYQMNEFLMVGGSSKVLFILANSYYLARQKQLGGTESLAYLKTSISDCIENDNMCKKHKLSKSERLLLNSVKTVQISI